jgi:hypothetical protein
MIGRPPILGSGFKDFELGSACATPVLYDWSLNKGLIDTRVIHLTGPRLLLDEHGTDAGRSFWK